MINLPAPRKIKRFGYVRNTPDHRDHKKAPHYSILSLPSDASVVDLLMPNYDQGDYGSCISNATGMGVMAVEKKEGNEVFMPARFFTYWNIRAIEHSGANNDCGGQIRDGVKSLKWWGLPPESMWPYIDENFSKEPTPDVYAAAKKHETLKYQLVHPDIDSIKASIAVDKLPVVFGMEVFDYLESDDMASKGLLQMPGINEASIGGHCVLFGAYDDHIVFDDPRAGVGGFRVRNSWGTDWGWTDPSDGSRGDFWISYKYVANANLCSDFTELSKAA